MKICTEHLVKRTRCATGTTIRCDMCGITWHIAQDFTSEGAPRVYGKFTYHRKVHFTRGPGHKGRDIVI